MQRNRATFAALTAAALIGLGTAPQAEPITFTKDILPIFQENCQVCHRDGGANLGGMVAPMSFETYEGARPWAKSIARAVKTKAMPPWHASPEQHGQFENERVLTDDEIDTIVEWAESGAKRGKPEDAPAPKVWPENDGWTIGTPDLIVKPDEPFFVGDDVSDLYVDLTTTMTEEVLAEDRYIKAVEFRPGSKVVHHIITFPLGGIAPGNEATVYPDGIAAVMPAGEDLSWEMHYNKEPGPGTGVWDHSSAAVIFYDDPSDVNYRMQGADLGRYDFKIPAGDPNYAITAEYTFKHDSSIIQLMPHFHLRGKSAHYEAIYPDGTREVLLDIPRYDFNWQTAYKYNEFKEVPAGTKVVFTSTFDNSADNPSNPDPTVNVRYGEPTYDEMSYGYMNFINDSDDYEYFFEEFFSETPDIVTIMWAADADHDEKMSKEEADHLDLGAYFPMIDMNKDGYVDLKEAETANRFMQSQQKQATSSD